MNLNDIRSSHPSSAQVEFLLEFLERNPGLAKGFLRTQNAKQRSRHQWEELAVRLNSLGGTTKTSKQWTKYWSDKKSAIKKKAAARSAARRRTGGGVDDVVELTEQEERIVALCGGESFFAGDAHLAIDPFPVNTPSPPHQRQHHFVDVIVHAAGTDSINETQEINTPPTEEPPVNVIYDSEQIINSQPPGALSIARRLFDTSSSSSVGTSQSILQNFQLPRTCRNPHSSHPSQSPPPTTLSQTTRLFGTASSSSVDFQLPRTCRNPHSSHPSQSPPPTTLSQTTRLFGTASSSSVDFQLPQTSRNPDIYHPSLSPPPATLSQTPIPSPSRRGSTQGASPAVRRRTSVSTSQRHATPLSSPSRRRRRVNMVRGGRHTGSLLSSQTSSTARPPSQRRTEFSSLTERFLRVEEQQLEIQRSNARILQSFLERSAERERVLTEAVTAVGKGLEALAEAMKRDRV